jgi:SOS response regulatory protein OraA/RecX
MSKHARRMAEINVGVAAAVASFATAEIPVAAQAEPSQFNYAAMFTSTAEALGYQLSYVACAPPGSVMLGSVRCYGSAEVTTSDSLGVTHVGEINLETLAGADETVTFQRYWPGVDADPLTLIDLPEVPVVAVDEATPAPTSVVPVGESPTTTTQPPVEQEPTTTVEASVPAEYHNALRTAESYLDFTAFSQQGLIEQLEYEQYSTEAAQWAVENVDVDWNEQAALKAAEYLEFQAFSEGGLRDQLEYEGFTPEQIDFAISEMKAQGRL